jgi:hypothetical protein
MHGTRSDVDVTQVVEALRAAVMPDKLTLFGVIMGYDDDTEQVVAHVALVLDYGEWTPEAIEACESASSAAWLALSPLEVVPNLLFRTRAEHEQFRKSEPGWILVSNVDC